MLDAWKYVVCVNIFLNWMSDLMNEWLRSNFLEGAFQYAEFKLLIKNLIFVQVMVFWGQNCFQPMITSKLWPRIIKIEIKILATKTTYSIMFWFMSTLSYNWQNIIWVKVFWIWTGSDFVEEIMLMWCRHGITNLA